MSYDCDRYKQWLVFVWLFCVLGRVIGRKMYFYQKSTIVFLDMYHGVIFSTDLIPSMFYVIATLFFVGEPHKFVFSYKSLRELERVAFK